ncbi:hypothetical protein CPB83DRAFT_896022 [Crepidotus variabilis]|uniref:Uncharacterized protein n=1 Tax=Crepidotus variabilis TaxID=179855 RepID=A0A9P6ECF0_9AGAR|nr:hypothetical protein CPB83DRAFT_896022 [Crepidotus variabilis]
MAQQQASRPTRWVVVDDTSPEISYLGPTGSWIDQSSVTSTFTRNDSGGVLNSNGQVYNGTQHGTRLPSSFSFAYTGIAIEAVGTIEYGNRDKGELQWHCFIDGNEVLNVTNITTMPPDNNWFICGDWQAGGSGDGQHLLTVNISATKELPFWIDWLSYKPSPDASLENKLVRLDIDEPSILAGLSTGWDTGMSETKTKGASFHYEFIGTSFTWYGLARLDHIDPPNGVLAIGSYSIDGGPQQPVNFPIVPSQGHFFNQKFLETGPLSMAKHNISVVYTYDGTYPLGLNFVHIQNGSLSDLTNLSSSNHRGHLSRGTTIILAAVIPAAVIVFAALAGLWVRRRRRHQRILEASGGEIDTPAVDGNHWQSPDTHPITPFSSGIPSPPHSPNEKRNRFAGEGSIYQGSATPEEDVMSIGSGSGSGSGSRWLGRKPTYASHGEPPPTYTA